MSAERPVRLQSSAAPYARAVLTSASPALAAALRTALQDAGTPTTASPTCSARRPTRPSRATRPCPACARRPGGSPVEALARLLLLQAPVARRAGRAAPCPACSTGLCAEPACSSAPSARSSRGVDVRPTPPTTPTSGWPATSPRASTARPTRVAPDHVLGISSAATSLAQLTVREPGRPRARPRHRLRRPVAAPRRPTPAGRRHRRQQPGAAADRFNAALNESRTSTSARAASSSRWPASSSTWS